jgi:hypothetical protein
VTSLTSSPRATGVPGWGAVTGTSSLPGRHRVRDRHGRNARPADRLANFRLTGRRRLCPGG